MNNQQQSTTDDQWHHDGQNVKINNARIVAKYWDLITAYREAGYPGLELTEYMDKRAFTDFAASVLVCEPEQVDAPEKFTMQMLEIISDKLDSETTAEPQLPKERDLEADLNEDPVAFVDRMSALVQLIKQYKAVATEYVEKHGPISGTAVIFDKKSLTKKLTRPTLQTDDSETQAEDEKLEARIIDAYFKGLSISEKAAILVMLTCLCHSGPSIDDVAQEYFRSFKHEVCEAGIRVMDKKETEMDSHEDAGVLLAATLAESQVA